MAEYEVVREVQNLCGNNQMRDVFFEEIETDDPVLWVRGFLKGKDVELTVDEKENGDLTVYAVSGGVSQKTGHFYNALRRQITLQQNSESLRLEGISGKSCRALSVHHVVCWLSSPKVVIIHTRQVIVYQRICVQHFNGTCRVNTAVLLSAARSAELHHQHRPYALAAGKQTVSH